MGTQLRFGLFIHVSGPIRQVANRCLAQPHYMFNYVYSIIRIQLLELNFSKVSSQDLIVHIYIYHTIIYTTCLQSSSTIFHIHQIKLPCLTQCSQFLFYPLPLTLQYVLSCLLPPPPHIIFFISCSSSESVKAILTFQSEDCQPVTADVTTILNQSDLTETHYINTERSQVIHRSCCVCMLITLWYKNLFDLRLLCTLITHSGLFL